MGPHQLLGIPAELCWLGAAAAAVETGGAFGGTPSRRLFSKSAPGATGLQRLIAGCWLLFLCMRVTSRCEEEKFAGTWLVPSKLPVNPPAGRHPGSSSLQKQLARARPLLAGSRNLIATGTAMARDRRLPMQPPHSVSAASIRAGLFFFFFSFGGLPFKIFTGIILVQLLLFPHLILSDFWC